jgi:hypothetical protein
MQIFCYSYRREKKQFKAQAIPAKYCQPLQIEVANALRHLRLGHQQTRPYRAFIER